MKKSANRIVTCYECKFADLMQWWDNPIIANCAKKEEREVAMSKRKCDMWEKDDKPKAISHYDKYT